MRFDTPRLLEIPGGELLQRDDRKKTQWRVQLSPFAVARTPITQAQYADLMGSAPSSFIGAHRPVEGVSWFQAIAYCNALSETLGFTPCYQLDGEQVAWDRQASGFRLPTDAEWQHACMAGCAAPRHGELDAIAWYRDNAEEQTHEVAQKAPNAWGLHDMLGNVWEWCWDLYDPEVYGEYRVFRGGGWADPERGCLATNRRRSHPSYQIDDLGFRVARTLPNTPNL